MKTYAKFAVVVLILTLIPSVSFAQTRWDDLLSDATLVFEEMTSMPDEAIPRSLLQTCKAVAIFPTTVNGGFIFGAKYGKGVIIARNIDTGEWSAPAFFKIAGGSLGFQIGGEAIDHIIVISSERGLNGLLETSFKLGADAGLAAGPVGRDVGAATDLHFKGGIYSYSKARGLFAGAKLEGSRLYFDFDSNHVYYDRALTAKDILVHKKVEPSESAKKLLTLLEQY
ncbi:MAG: lipid-binding SYLF domain-containing protein [Candidatus Omnitrophica bacterium]|nr:lipid-binding SYLF domain-containing protein [Candidatus Omnitrophota bacterium]